MHRNMKRFMICVASAVLRRACSMPKRTLSDNNFTTLTVGVFRGLTAVETM